MVKRLNTLAEVQAAFAKHCKGPQTEGAKVASESANRFHKLEPESIAELNRHTAEFGEVYLVDIQADGVLDFLLGLEPATNGEVPFITIGKDAYVAKRNRNNRKVSLTRVGPISTDGTYANSESRGLWGLTASDPWTFDWDGQILSAQHRGIAKVYLRNAGLRLEPVYIYLGVPPQWRDLADKARPRNAKDDDETDDTVCPLSIISEIQLTMHGETDTAVDLKKERTRCIDLRKKLIGNLELRLKGSEISTTGDKLQPQERFEFVERLGGEDVIGKYVSTIREYGRAPTGKYDRQFVSLFHPNIVATALILASNDETAFNARLALIERNPNETPEEYVERQIAERHRIQSEGEILIDWKLVKDFMEALSKSTVDSGPFAKVFADLFERRKTDKKDKDMKKYLWTDTGNCIAAMSAIVELINNFRKGETEASVWTVYRRKSDNEVSPYYRCFGGLDVGYTKSTTRKGKKSDE